MASSSSRAVRGIRFSEAPFIEPVVTAAHSSTSAEAENGQLAPNTSDCSPSNRDAQNAASGSNPEQRRQDGIQRSSFNPSASVWVPSASTQQARQRDDTRPLVVGYPPGYRVPNFQQNQSQAQVQGQAQVQSQAQYETPRQDHNQFDMVSFALAHTQGNVEDPNAGMP
ncbi:hypothetical protein THARTR1_09777 [Trichoderma harzianum]|uniref:Uncharacterized protein n=1 Tax=Trichoderma harzianum TaxID=5544 RepID=A0A2K0TV98_TRIHA|nr:hypothetical protein THARTR1_09777 [Trichoderma harzianum]